MCREKAVPAECVPALDVERHGNILISCRETTATARMMKSKNIKHGVDKENQESVAAPVVVKSRRDDERTPMLAMSRSMVVGE